LAQNNELIRLLMIERERKKDRERKSESVWLGGPKQIEQESLKEEK
jgi:hypothetical protein